MQVKQMGMQQVRENAAPVPHGPSSSLGTTQITQKLKERNRFKEKLILYSGFIIIGLVFLIMALGFNYLLAAEIPDDMFTFDGLTTPWNHAMFMAFVGMGFYVSLPVGAMAMFSAYAYKSLTLHSPIQRKHLIIFSMIRTEVIMIPLLFFSSVFLTIMLWDNLSNPILFMFFCFFGLYFTIRAFYALISIIGGSSELPKKAAHHRLRVSLNLLFTLVIFFPLFLFLYEVMAAQSISLGWFAMNEHPLAQLTFMLPNAILILISEDIWIWTKITIVLILLGVNISLSYIQYILFSTTSEVTWKKGYVFHKHADRRKHFKDMHGKPRISPGWDLKEERGLKALDRVPIRIFIREQRAIEGIIGTLAVSLMIFIIFIGLHPVLMLYTLLVIPFLFPFMVLLNWGIFLAGEGMKFFKLFPFTPKQTTRFLTAFIDKRSLSFAVLFPILLYIPLWLLNSIHLRDLIVIGVLIITLFVGWAILFYLATIFKLKNQASPMKGHILAFYLKIFHKTKRTKGFLFDIYEGLAFGYILVSIMFAMGVIIVFPMIFLISGNIMLQFFNVTLFVSTFLFIRASHRDNMLAFLSNNQIHVRFEEKWIPFATIISSLVGIIIFFVIPFFGMIGIL
jgi:hypothetical protein